MRIILMIGPQGSGKGTQSERISAKLGIPAVSLGQMLRAAAESDTPMGREIAETMNRGERLPEPLVNKMAYERMLRPDAAKGVVLDGYPRSISQAHDLDAMLKGIGAVVTDAVLLRISDEEAMRRLSGRLVCSNVSCEAKYHREYAPPKVEGVCDRCGSALIQRADDKPEAIARRLELYHKDTTPIIGHYMERMVLRDINGEQSMDAVEKDIFAQLSA